MDELIFANGDRVCSYGGGESREEVLIKSLEKDCQEGKCAN